MSTFYKPVKTLIATVVGLALTGSVMAADMARDSGKRMSASEYNESVKGTKSEYNAALKACGDTRGTERTNCRKEARMSRDTAMREARAQRGPVAGTGGPKSTNETAGASTGGPRPAARDSNMASPKTPKSTNETAGIAPDQAGGTRGSSSRAEVRGTVAGNPTAATPKSPNETAPTK